MRRNRHIGGSMQALGKLMREAYPAEAPDEAHAVRLLGCWARAVSERILRNALPVSYRSGVLTVHTTTTSWANALSLEESSLIAKLRLRAPGVPLQRLIFRLGRLPPFPDHVKPEPPLPKLLPLEAIPDDIARELARVGNDALRERISHAIAISLADRVHKVDKR